MPELLPRVRELGGRSEVFEASGVLFLLPMILLAMTRVDFPGYFDGKVGQRHQEGNREQWAEARNRRHGMVGVAGLVTQDGT